MFEWCSISEITISSPGPSRNRGSPPRPTLALRNEYATRLIASVEFFVNTTSSGDVAPMNAATFARAPSYASVASVPSVCTDLATLRVVQLEVLAHRVQHLPRLLRGVRRVEVDQPVPVDLTVQDREVRPYLVHVEARHVVVLRHARRDHDRRACLRHVSLLRLGQPVRVRWSWAVGPQRPDPRRRGNARTPRASSRSASSGPPSSTMRPPTKTCTKSGVT